MAEERVDQNTEQESQDALVETLADRVLLRVQQKLQSQEGRAHESGSVSMQRDQRRYERRRAIAIQGSWR